MSLVCDGNGNIPVMDIIDDVNRSVKIDEDTTIQGTLDITEVNVDTLVVDGKKLVASYPTFRNKIINGGFNVWQEIPNREVFIENNNQKYFADLFPTSNIGAGGIFKVREYTMGLSNSVRFTVDTPSNDLSATNAWSPIAYRFEGQDMFYSQGENVTVSFRFKTNVVGKYSVALRNTTDSVWADSYVSEFEVTVPDVDEKYSITIPIPTTFTTPLKNDENIGFVLEIATLNNDTFRTASLNQWLSNQNKSVSIDYVNWSTSVGNYIEIADLQLENGDEATPFGVTQISDTESRVSRYYIKSTADADGWNFQMIGLYKSNRDVSVSYSFPNIMRVPPVLNYSNRSDFVLAPYYYIPAEIRQNTSSSLSMATFEVEDAHNTWASRGYAGALILDTQGGWISFDSRL